MVNAVFVVSLPLHLLFLISVFDIYFRSPIIASLEPVPCNIEVPAHRLVLFVADGLRADYFYRKDNKSSLSPFLRNIVESVGAWGVSHTQVPTESRPGHVALIAGIYEDPSAVFKGWKENLVNFDSVFNRSYATFSFGSPDILPIFSKGNKKETIFNYMYEASLQDFSGQQGLAAKLNYWVLERFEEFLQSDVKNATIYDLVHQKGVIFFFHLLGTDVAGHASKPGSKEYDDCIEAADLCARKISKLMRDYYKDDKTVFLYTADHGMTDWGSHGDGSRDETETPIVAWGAGVRGPIFEESDSPKDWGLNYLRRSDIRQADVAPLMSVLAGLPIPVNSVGSLPYDFLQGDEYFILQAMTLNVKQLARQYNATLWNIRGRVFDIFYEPYDQFNREIQLGQIMQRAKSYNESIEAAKEMIAFYNDGITYFKNYFSTFLKVLVAFVYILWITNLFLALLVSSKSINDKASFVAHSRRVYTSMDFRFSLGALTAYVIFFIQKLEWSFYAYLLVIMYLLSSIYSYIILFLKLGHLLRDIPRSFDSVWRTCFTISGFAAILYCLIFGFTNRTLLSLMMLLVALWPVAFHMDIFSTEKDLLFRWFYCCFTTSIFPLLPTISPGCSCTIHFVFLSTSLSLLLAYYKSTFMRTDGHVIRPMYIFMSILLALALLDELIVEYLFQYNIGLNSPTQLLSWFILGMSFVFVVYGSVSCKVAENCVCICGFLNIPYLLLCARQEALYPLFFVPLVITWTEIETYIQNCHEVRQQYFRTLLGTSSNRESRIPLMSYLRISLFYLTFVIMAFFGIGNIASLSSFDPLWTRRFITVFSPFTMTFLIILKSVLPMMMAACSLHVLRKKCKIPFEPLMISTIIFADIIGAVFFLRVTNKGSWLTIGTSISHFVVSEVITLIILCLYYTVRFVMDSSYLKSSKRTFRRIVTEPLPLHDD